MGNILVPIKKFLSNKNTITILGVLLGVVVLYVGYNWRVNKSIDPVKVPIATSTLTAGTKITEDNISYTEVPKDMVSSMTNLVTDVSKISGMLVSYDSKIAMNGFFFTENLITEEEMPDSVFSNIQDGYTVYALSVSFETTYANSIFPDDMIDLYLFTEDEDGKVVYGRLIKSIQVLAVKDKNGNNVFTDKDNTTEPAQLLFAVPEDLFLLLKKIEKLSWTLEPVGRNDSYTKNASATELTSEELQAMVINETHIISDECTDLTLC